ncbi:MAG TPA: S53 family peptidase [Streptosporangiaceae bacterium]|nr:S53 family peptidase [Streptosporangiaceae bacterium]
MTRVLRRAGLVVAALSPMVAVGMVAGPASAAGRHSLLGSKPTWATAKARSGPAASSSAIAGRVALAFNHAADVRALAAAVSDRRSPQYGRYLTSQQFNARFRPTNAQVASVTKWLRGAGLTVDAVPATHRYVAFHGSLAHASKAFGTSFGVYRYHGASYTAPDTVASVPAALSGTVLTVMGLDSMPHTSAPLRTGPFPPPPGFRNPQPCSAYYGQKVASTEADGTTPLPQFDGQTLNYTVCGYTPSQLRGAYGLDPTAADGSGVTVAIVDAYAAPTIVSDTNQYVDNHDSGSPHLTPGGNFLETDPSQFTGGHVCGGNGWYGEETLDVQAVHGMAPGATIHYYGGASCFDTDLEDAVQRAIDDNVDVITNSYGSVELQVPTSEMLFEQQQYLQAASQGITVLFSSGDNGDESQNIGVKSADTPVNDPYVTAVGGTALGIGASNNVVFETGWGTVRHSLTTDENGNLVWSDAGTFLYGSGGGVSAFFNQPDYQQGVAPNVHGRVVPDISLDGDVSTGMLVGETQQFGHTSKTVQYDEYKLGGTSLSSPLFAGVIAIADQLAHASGHGNVGFANPSIYDLARNGSSAIRDVVHAGVGNVRADFVNGIDDSNGLVYSVRTFDQDTSLTTHSGYDEVTGVGTPTGGFAAAMAAAAPPA